MEAFAAVTIGALIGACGGLWVALLAEQRKRYRAERELADLSVLLAVYSRPSSRWDIWDDEPMPSNVVKFGKSA